MMSMTPSSWPILSSARCNVASVSPVWGRFFFARFAKKRKKASSALPVRLFPVRRPFAPAPILGGCRLHPAQDLAENPNIPKRILKSCSDFKKGRKKLKKIAKKVLTTGVGLWYYIQALRKCGRRKANERNERQGP